jgi:hypothetical protein
MEMIMNDSLPEDNAQPLPPQTSEPISIEVTLIESTDPLTKTYHINPDGEPEVCGRPYLSSGTAHRLYIPSDSFATDFAALLTQ